VKAMQFEEVDMLDRIRQAKSAAGSSAEREKLAAAERLVTLSRSYAEVNRFRVGDLVTWKPGMRNRRMPAYDDVVIVSGLIEGGRYGPEKSSGSPYFREPETLKVAFIDESDGEFVEFCMDRQRFRHVAEEDCVPRKVKMLRERLQIFLAPPAAPLKVGDRVYWKPNMKHKKRPDREPAIVTEVLEQPILDEDKPGSQYWHEPLDVKIAMRDGDGEFVAYYFDKRRFQKVDDDDESYNQSYNNNGNDSGEDNDSDDDRMSSDVD